MGRSTRLVLQTSGGHGSQGSRHAMLWEEFMKAILLAALLTTVSAIPSFAADQVGAAMMAFDNQFQTLIRLAIEKDAGSAVKVQFEDGQMDIQRQMDQVQNLLSSGVKALIVSPIDASATAPMTAAAEKAGIPIVYVNNKPLEKLPANGVAFVGSDESEAGKLQMQEVCKLLNGKGKILIVMGGLSFEQTRLRTGAAEDVLKTSDCSGISVIDKQAGDWSRTSGNNLVSNWLSAGMKPDAIIANNDEMALGALQALEAAGISVGVGGGKVVVAGIDSTQDAMKSIKDGKMAASVFQDAVGQGKGALDTAQKMMRREEIKQDTYIPFELVTASNVDKYMNRN
jgi:inositol transport system substrate-binding protein